MLDLSMILEVPVTADPEREALRFGAETMSFRKLRDLGVAWGDLLDRTGARSVVAIGENHPGIVGLLLGSSIAGVDFTPLNPRLKTEEILHALQLVEAEIMFVWDVRSDSPEKVSEAGSVPVFRMRGAKPPDHLTIIPRQGDAPKPCVHVLTSGTTTKPKAVVLDHELVINYLFASYEPFSAASAEAVLVAAPMFHIAGLMNTLSGLFTGRRVILLPRFDPCSWLDTAAAEKVTHAFLVPTMLAQVVHALEERDRPDLALRSIAYGGAPSRPADLVRAAMAFPNADLVGAFGLSETSSTICMLGPEDHRRALASSDAGHLLSSVGKPMPGISIEIRASDGETLGPSETGEIVVKGTQVSGRYKGASARLDERGWFHTGDTGRFDAEGYLYIVGRVDDMIQRGAENVSPLEVELVFESHPAVREAAAFGVIDDEWGQVVGLAVVPSGFRHGLVADLSDFALEKLAPFKRPAHYLIVEELPRNDLGKVLRKDLRAQLDRG